MRADSSNEYRYLWSPDYKLTCTTCTAPVAQPLQSTEYILDVTDTNKCFTKPINILIPVKEQYSVVLPSSFTPNGDNHNDVILARGSGIKELIEFRIYNRWGDEVFYTNDINQGWDGTYKGKPQSIDAYTYIVKAIMWDGQTKTIKGTFTLLR